MNTDATLERGSGVVLAAATPEEVWCHPAPHHSDVKVRCLQVQQHWGVVLLWCCFVQR